MSESEDANVNLPQLTNSRITSQMSDTKGLCQILPAATMETSPSNRSSTLCSEPGEMKTTQTPSKHFGTAMKGFLSLKRGRKPEEKSGNSESDSDETDDEKQLKKIRKPLSKATKRRGKSNTVLWKFFTEDPKDPNYAVCSVQIGNRLTCNARLKRPESNTSAMQKHLKSIHPKEFSIYQKEYGKFLVDKAKDSCSIFDSQKELEEAVDEAREILGKTVPSRKMPFTKTIDSYFKRQEPKKFQSTSEKQKKIDFEIMTFLAKMNFPFSSVDHPAFQE